MMEVTEFYSLKIINGNKDFHRKNGKYNKPGVYFWGFTLRDDCQLPKKSDELVIYYIGVSQKNVVERIMQEVTQFIFGGFETIIDYKFLKRSPYTALIKQKRDEKKTPDPDVIYNSDGLHVLYDFLTNSNIKQTVDWMRERLIFSWIQDIDKKILDDVEREFHHMVRTNVLGVRHMTKLTPKTSITNTIYFNQIDWKKNTELKDWFKKVNSKLP